jgi:GntR family transcriptional repressor for pyruvate dehydrogenase complex
MTMVARPQKTALILAQRIVRDVHREGLSPGDKLQSERLMMEQYDVGRGTLREALRYLEFQGLLSFKPGPGGGPVIEKPGAESLAATLALLLQFDGAPYRVVAEARAAFEPLMARLAAERITRDRLGELQQTLVDMEDGLQDNEAYLDSNRRFHDVIAWASGNSLFGFLIDVMVGSMDMSGASHGIQYPAKKRQAVLTAHRNIYLAIEKGDPGSAEEAMESHIQEYFNYAVRRFPDAMDRLIVWG